MLEGFLCKHRIHEALFAVAFAVGSKRLRQASQDAGRIGFLSETNFVIWPGRHAGAVMEPASTRL
jgi:hypothetical protein